MGISIGELKTSVVIQYNQLLYMVVACEHAKLGRGAAFCRVRLRNLKTSQIIDCTLRDSDDIRPVFTEKRKLQYLYRGTHHYHFMDLVTYEDLIINETQITDKTVWLKDNLELAGIFCNNELIDLELPAYLELKVVKTEPGFKGNTVKAGSKSAQLETGLVINVPLFISNGDKVKVDTRTKSYAGKA